MDVSNPRDIEQVGYYVTQGTFWAAYFALAGPDRETVYALDTASGLDVLHIERPDTGLKPRKKPTSESELETRTTWGTPSPRWVFACPLPAL